MNIRFGPIRNIARLQTYLKNAPRGAVRATVKAFANYIMGDSRHGLRHDDPYKFVSRAKAYGKVSDAPAGYFSWKQFRYVMGAIARGDIKPGSRANNPTNASQGYAVQETNGGYGATITNDTAGGYWTRHDKQQPRQLAMVGWKKYMQVVRDNTAGAIRSATAAVNKFLRTKG